jgi:hypothetical protein
MNRRTSSLRLILSAALALGLSSVPAGAADPADTQTQLNGEVQALKRAVLQMEAELQTAETALLHPPQTRITLFLGVQINHLLLETLSLQIDDQPAVVHTYTEQQAKNLLKSKGLQRLPPLNAAPGPHRLRVAYTGRYADVPPERAATSGVFESIFDKPLDALELELRLTRIGRRPEPDMTLTPWQAAR